jgi:hypothetical protein
MTRLSSRLSTGVISSEIYAITGDVISSSAGLTGFLSIPDLTDILSFKMSGSSRITDSSIKLSGSSIRSPIFGIDITIDVLMGIVGHQAMML